MPGYEHLDLGTVTREQQRAMERKLRHATKLAEVDRGGTIRVPTRVHVIRRNNANGGVSNAQIDAQLQVLNRSWCSARFAGRSSSRNVHSCQDRHREEGVPEQSRPQAGGVDVQRLRAALPLRTTSATPPCTRSATG
ncbi:MAG: hypothetical protein M3353_06200 [Actinomycetota bacterium]|nr:hypothetical protein [Actinomycetota bacterium]